jgi:hypothetical protein
MSTPRTLRNTAVLAAVGALLLAALAIAQTAQAETISACYKRSSGALRILHGRQHCRKGEARVFWNIVGPPGRTGATGKGGATGKIGPAGKNGTNGTNGTNAADTGYFATQAGTLNITEAAGRVLSQELPIGHYLVSAKVEVSAAAKEAGGVQVECKLVLTTATGESVLDSSEWTAPLVSFVEPEYLGAAALSLDSPVTLTASASVLVACETVHAGAKEETVAASKGQLVAVQTTSNS